MDCIKKYRNHMFFLIFCMIIAFGCDVVRWRRVVPVSLHLNRDRERISRPLAAVLASELEVDFHPCGEDKTAPGCVACQATPQSGKRGK